MSLPAEPSTPAAARTVTAGALADGSKAAPPSAPSKSVLHAKVAAPFRVYFDGEAFSVSAENGTGLFDVLPRHHNFISLLRACDITIRSRQGELRIKISGGLMHVSDNQVAVFLDV